MASVKERLTSRTNRVRESRPVVDHAFKTVAHYGTVNGNAQAAAATYFGFLSFFPILALAFFVIGYVSRVYPDAQDQLVYALGEVLPGVVGEGEGEISISTFENYAGTIGLIGLVGVLYAGLGWLSGMRSALEVMFRLPRKEQPSFVLGKARDLTMLAVIGVVLLLSVALTAAVSKFSGVILGWVSLDDSRLAGVVLWVVGHGLVIAATTVLFVAMFELLVQPGVPWRALFEGAALGAIGFEVLKSVASVLIATTKERPAFQAFGVALILLLWINYFSRLVMFSAAWAHTSGEAQAGRDGTEALEPGGSEPVTAPPMVAQAHSGDPRRLVVAAAAGAGAAAVAALALRKHLSDGEGG